MAYDVYPLPHSLKPCEPVDTTDTRYLNQSYTPVANPLKKALHVELYNENGSTNPFKPLSQFFFVITTVLLMSQLNLFLLFQPLLIFITTQTLFLLHL